MTEVVPLLFGRWKNYKRHPYGSYLAEIAKSDAKVSYPFTKSYYCEASQNAKVLREK
ncbi:hypothetical protein [Shewanella sp. S23-S33]|uniref:hypothetical protein n=1 Tax=Shewanella sp. S23-S33 TaxID=3342769 RepID=UPI00372D15D2